MVHGQIILNQFKNFPKKSVANSAFVSGLKAKMELRRHCKLYNVQRPKGRLRVSSMPFLRSDSHAPVLLCCAYIPESTLQKLLSCSPAFVLSIVTACSATAREAGVALLRGCGQTLCETSRHARSP